MEEYIKVIKNYVNFKGRAPRREFWMFVLINILISIGLSILDNALGLNFGSGPSKQGILGSIYSLFIFLPNLAVTVRRLHDTNKPGWYILVFYAIAIVFGVYMALNPSGSSITIFALVLLAISIYFIVLLATEGDKGANDYGPDPYGSDELDIEDHLI